MNTPQLILIALFSVSLGMSAAKHGEPKTGKENAWASLVAMAIQVALLYWGGFLTNTNLYAK